MRKIRHPRLSRRSKSAKIKLEHIDRLSAVVASCKALADASPVPGLPLLFVIAKAIIDTVKNARTNVEDSLKLADRACQLLKAILEQPQCKYTSGSEDATTPSFPVSHNVEVFCVTLKDIQASLSQITDRDWYTAIFYHLRDRRIVDDNVQKLDEAVVLFQVSGVKSLRDDTTGMKHRLDQISGSVNQMFRQLEGLFVKNLALWMQPGEQCRNSSTTSLETQVYVPGGSPHTPSLLDRIRVKEPLERQRRPYVEATGSQSDPAPLDRDNEGTTETTGSFLVQENVHTNQDLCRRQDIGEKDLEGDKHVEEPPQSKKAEIPPSCHGPGRTGRVPRTPRTPRASRIPRAPRAPRARSPKVPRMATE